jgi:hypothetical protein
MTLGEFLEKYYPQSKIDRNERKRLFISEYKRIKPRGASDFNERKADDVPTWVTFARMFGVARWLEWLKFCGLEKSSPTLRARARSNELEVISYNDLLIKLEAIPKMPKDFQEKHKQFMIMMDKRVEEILKRSVI